MVMLPLFKPQVVGVALAVTVPRVLTVAITAVLGPSQPAAVVQDT
jgi:hypothetical protein